MRPREVMSLLDLAAPPVWGRTRRLAACRNIEDLHGAFRRSVPRAVADFVDGGAEDEVTLRRNRAAFERVRLLPHHFAGLAGVDLGIELLGDRVAMPVALAPTGIARLVHPDGELAVARAAARAGLIYTVPCMGSATLEEVAAAVPPGTPQWFQLYVWRDRGLTRELVQRAQNAGYRALVVTLDTPVSGARERDIANGMNVPPKLTRAAAIDAARHPAWWMRFLAGPPPALENVRHRTPSATDTTTMEYVAQQFEPQATWADLQPVLDAWNGPVIAKGVLSATDAERAVEAGATGVIVSNHGGRQLDRAPSSFEMLPAVAEAVGDRATVLIDSGIRRGGDVVAALAAGASACFVGRPYLYGLGTGGEAGVMRAIELLEGELLRTMTLLGAGSPDELDDTFLAAPGALERYAPSSAAQPSSGTWLPVEDWAPRPDGWERRDVPGVAVDASDRVWVISRDETPVTVRSSDGTVLDSWGAGVFARPHSIRIDPFGFIWLVDDGDHTVRKFSVDGNLLMVLGDPGHGSDTGVVTVDGNYQKFDYREVVFGGPPFNGPTDVCVLPDGTTFVTDGYGNARVHRFSASGELERSWGEPGSGPGQFHIPHGVVASPDQDRLFVADRENDRIQVFDLDGALLDEWRGFSRPDGIAISPDGLLCVPELGERAGRWAHMDPVTDESPFGRCAIVDLDGTVLERFGTGDPSRPGSFYAPHGVAFDARGDLYVTEVAQACSGGARLDDLPHGWHTLQKLERAGR